MRLWALGIISAAGVYAASPQVDFSKDIQPVLVQRCAACHGPQQQMNGFRVDDRDSLMKAVVAGNSGASKIITRVTSTKKGFLMPPVGPPLKEAEVPATCLDRRGREVVRIRATGLRRGRSPRTGVSVPWRDPSAPDVRNGPGCAIRSMPSCSRA
jgi:hypothetical protein